MDLLDEIKKKLIEAIEPVIKDDFMELVDVELMQGHYVRITIDRISSKVSVDDCAAVSRKIERIPGIEDIMKGSFTFEVSSPGIDRPLRKEADYKRFAGERAKVITSEKIENENVFVGTILSAEGGLLLLDVSGRERKIELEKIKKANLYPAIFRD